MSDRIRMVVGDASCGCSESSNGESVAQEVANACRLHSDGLPPYEGAAPVNTVLQRQVAGEDRL